ncbi:hypothetical protein GCM10027578_20900 [Spirosoma luteolum]
MAARLGDMTVHGGRIVVGCPTVLIGGPTFTTPSFFAKFLNIFLDNLKFEAGLVVGFVGGVINTVEGLINVLLHPIETIKSIFKLAESIIFTLSKKERWIALTKRETWVEIKDYLGNIYDNYEKASSYEKGKVIGKATEFIAELLLVPEAKVAVAGEVVETAKFAEAVKGAAGIEKVEKTAEVGEIVYSKIPSIGAGRGNWGRLKGSEEFDARYAYLNANLEADEKFKQLGSFKTLEGREHFWNEHNKPYLDKVVEKGERFRLFDDPNYDMLIYQDGNVVKGETFFGREMQYLSDKGYTIDYKDGWINPPIKK